MQASPLGSRPRGEGRKLSKSKKFITPSTPLKSFPHFWQFEIRHPGLAGGCSLLGLVDGGPGRPNVVGRCRLERGGLGSPKKMLGHADLEPPHWEESAGASLLKGGGGMPVNRKVKPLLRGV